MLLVGQFLKGDAKILDEFIVNDPFNKKDKVSKDFIVTTPIHCTGESVEWSKSPNNNVRDSSDESKPFGCVP